MKKLNLLLAVILVLGVLWLPAALAGETTGKQLTPQQQQEIAPLYDQLFNIRSLIIDKYVEFKLIEPEKAEKIKERLKQAHTDLEKNGYIFKGKHKGKCPDFAKRQAN